MEYKTTYSFFYHAKDNVAATASIRYEALTMETYNRFHTFYAASDIGISSGGGMPRAAGKTDIQ